jgi:hypothetical protein
VWFLHSEHTLNHYLDSTARANGITFMIINERIHTKFTPHQELLKSKNHRTGPQFIRIHVRYCSASDHRAMARTPVLPVLVSYRSMGVRASYQERPFFQLSDALHIASRRGSMNGAQAAVADDSPLDSLSVIEAALKSTGTPMKAPLTPSKGGLASRMKLRAAIRATIISNHVNQRRFADGSVRNDVKSGAAKEAQHHGPGGGLSFISSRAQSFFEHAYTKFGKWVESHHHLSIAIGALILLSGVPGTASLGGHAKFLWFNVDTDLSAFALTSTRAYKQVGKREANGHAATPTQCCLLSLTGHATVSLCVLCSTRPSPRATTAFSIPLDRHLSSFRRVTR